MFIVRNRPFNLSGGSHEVGGVENVEIRRHVFVGGRVKQRLGGRSSDRSEFGEKRVIRVERGHGNFGFVGGGIKGA